MTYSKHINIPIFLPEIACPNKCIYCNQKDITGINKLPDTINVIKIIETHLNTTDISKTFVEVAFFGGNFTGIPIKGQKELLASVQPYIKSGQVKHIRISTRPDFINEDNLKILAEMGVSVIELGIQSTNNDVLRISKRGYDLAAIKNSAELIKSYGFKLGMQMMTGLPGDTAAKSLQTAKDIIAFGADMTRIYPLLVIRNTDLERMYLTKLYNPLSLNNAVEECKDIFKLFIKNDIRILKIGLHPSKELANGNAIVAGPFHQSFAELVYTKFWKEKLSLIDKAPNTNLVLNINPTDYNHVIGFKGENKKWLLNKFQKVKFLKNNSIKRFEFHVDNS